MQISFSQDLAFPEDRPDLMLQDSILGDRRRIISFRLGVNDAELLEKEYPVFSAET